MMRPIFNKTRHAYIQRFTHCLDRDEMRRSPKSTTPIVLKTNSKQQMNHRRKRKGIEKQLFTDSMKMLGTGKTETTRELTAKILF